jgi:hypothetical protein
MYRIEPLTAGVVVLLNAVNIRVFPEASSIREDPPNPEEIGGFP